MSIESQIEAAWQKCHLNILGRPTGESFREGYLAALRSLYVESGLDELRDWWNRCDDEFKTPFWGLVDGKYIRITARWFRTGYRAFELGTETIVDPSQIIRLNDDLPSPSDIFGRGE